MTEEADHLRRIVQRMTGERLLLVEKTVLACAGIIRRKMQETTDQECIHALQDLLDELEAFDKQKVIED